MKSGIILATILFLGLVGLGALIYRSNSTPTSGNPTTTGSSPVANTASSTTLPGKFEKVSSEPLQVGGKPHLLMFGAQFCPFCAAQRWSMKIATERFGKWENLLPEQSTGSNEPYLNIPTYNFYQARYTSDYLSLVHIDYADRSGRTLEKSDQLTSDLVNKYNSHGSIPFVLIGGQYSRVGSPFNPGILQGKSFSEVEKALGDSRSEISRSILTDADIMTAYLCKLTGGQPNPVCGTNSVKEFLAQIP